MFIIVKSKRMAQKYIEGDIVEYDNKVMAIKEPRDGSHFDLSCPKEGLVYCFVSVEDIAPIPITPEILKKNGWQEGYGIYYYDDVTVVPMDEGYCIIGLKEIADVLHINYIHQLQHFLFGLGLNSEMEV